MKKILQKHTLLLSVVLILGAIRFIIIPIVTWQASTIQSIEQLGEKFAKTMAVVDAEEIYKENLKEYKRLFEEHSALIVNYNDESTFRVEKQKKLESEFSKHSLDISNIGWQPSLPIGDSGYTEHQIIVGFSGTLVGFVHIITYLESSLPKGGIHNLSVDLTRPDSDGTIRVRGVVHISYFMKEDK
ncbi:hypothetical protein BGP78_10945 [Pseudoalteromonas sp. MSK9-3]|uniref:hypothetical protein n=1 Tax=Pseudoalteromonas sp. MSK9-3 TaxID=1897633 RepID=UPI000E6C7366|nr:hypothetical protein [Pseudoalteromonas sp. MSK9-3]RJE76912.1 hypothetical protein BGP78_10945 [Pseudoalteromonas sp. MSK9-3]